jgi:predicted TIM-barrel fold metal-dependent hydrolase
MTHGFELPPPGELVALMRERGVGALYLFHRQFNIPLEDWAVDDLLAALEAARVPLLLCPTKLSEPGAVDVTDWSNVVRICRQFPELPVVVVEERIYAGRRPMYEALEACPNLKVDMSALWLHKCVEFICREWGAERLVWSARLPRRTPAASLMQLNYSDIGGSELAAIAGGNLRELLSWNPSIEFAGEAELSEPVDALHRAGRERLSLREESFYDCHGHIGWCSPRHVVHDTPADLVAEMDKLGIRACCVFSFAGSMADDVHGNDVAAAVVQAYPDRFVGFTLVNLNQGERLMLAELQRGLELGMQGVKLVPGFQQYPLQGPMIDVACQFAHEQGQFILNHYWGPADHLRRLCTTYPDACFITGHTTTEYVDVVREVDNLFICTCPLLGWGQTEQYVQLYGAERLLFGSDLTDLPIAWGLGPILYAHIDEADKRKILGDNLLCLMERYGVRPRGR